jgi:hypothetical protein
MTATVASEQRRMPKISRSLVLQFVRNVERSLRVPP